MTLIKTSLLSFIATAIKMLSALVINKAVAAFIGPSGLALIGQFQNFSQLVMLTAEAALNSGVTKYTAEYGQDNDRLAILFSTALKISLCSSVVVGFFLVVFSEYISLNILRNDSFYYVFVVFGFTIILFVMNSLLLSIINGLREIKTWVKINIIQSIYSLIFTSLLIVYFGLSGALIALVSNQSVIFIVVIWMLRKHKIVCFDNFKKSFNRQEAMKLSGFASMTIASSVLSPISHLFMRNHLGESLGWEKAGYWQAIWYISSMYLMVVTTTLSTYYLPRLSEIKNKTELKRELLYGYKIIMPIVIISSVIIYFLRDFIVYILFTEEFSGMSDLFLWQLVGDVIKIASWLLSYLMLAKAMTKIFILSEFLFTALLVSFSYILTNIYGVVGMTYAFSLNYSLYFVFVFFVYRGYMKNE